MFDNISEKCYIKNSEKNSMWAYFTSEIWTHGVYIHKMVAIVQSTGANLTFKWWMSFTKAFSKYDFVPLNEMFGLSLKRFMQVMAYFFSMCK